MADDMILDEETEPKRAKVGLFTILAGVGFLLCLVTPRIALDTPALATIICGVVGFFRRERPRWLPPLLTALAVLVVMVMYWPDITLPNSIRYRHAEWQYGSDQTDGSWARIYSDTDLDLAPPYEGDNPTYLQIYSSNNNVLLVVDKGQILAPFRDCTVEMNMVMFSCSTPDGYDNSHLLISPMPDGRETPGDVVRRGVGVSIRVKFFDNGYRNVHFVTKGLNMD